METLADIGEFGLIHRIRRFIEEYGVKGSGLIVGAGDDTAAMSPSPGHDLLVTCDVMVEGRHFLKEAMSPEQIGRRAMVMNISDIGAMGGRPQWALVSLGLNRDTTVRDVLGMYRGFLDELNPMSALIAGGNISCSQDATFIDITLMGEVERGRMVRRSGGRSGDAVLVSGYPGQAAAGLQLLLDGGEEVEAPEVRSLLDAYRNPAHRAREGQAVAATGLANAMIDISDGLRGDLGHVCEESRAGAEVYEEALPVSDSMEWICRRRGWNPQDFLFGASDDYELIVTCAPGHVQALKTAVAPVPMTRVGWITDVEGRMDLIHRDGTRSTFEPGGWDHFSSRHADWKREK